jgi:hypothetical protein
MSKVSERIQEIGAIRMDIQSKVGKFHQNLNLLLAIILGVIIPELAILVAFAWVFGWLNVEFQQTNNTASA